MRIVKGVPPLTILMLYSKFIKFEQILKDGISPVFVVID